MNVTVIIYDKDHNIYDSFNNIVKITYTKPYYRPINIIVGEFNPFSLMFTRGGIPAISAFVRPIRKETLDEIIEEVFDE